MADLRTHFDLFALPVRFELAPDELERRYREASRHWHPDRFSRAPAAERAQVLARATDLNQAYRTLKDDWRRAEYLLKLRGLDLGSEEAGKQPPLSPDFLGEVMELQEELLEARSEATPTRLEQLRLDIERRIDALRQEVSARFAKLEAGAEPELATLATPLLQCRYYRRFREEIASIEESRTAAAESAAAAIPPVAAL